MTPTEARSILGLDEEASPLEIKRAYRNLAKLLHPDRHQSKSPQARAAADEAMKRVNHAYFVLTRSAPRKASPPPRQSRPRPEYAQYQNSNQRNQNTWTQAAPPPRPRRGHYRAKYDQSPLVQGLAWVSGLSMGVVILLGRVLPIAVTGMVGAIWLLSGMALAVKYLASWEPAQPDEYVKGSKQTFEEAYGYKSEEKP